MPSSAASSAAAVLGLRARSVTSSFRFPNAIEWSSMRTRPAPSSLLQLADELGALRGVERVGVPGAELDARAAQLLELGLDAVHRAAPVAVHEGEVHAVRGELVGGGEPEAARAAEDHSPVL